MVRRIIRFPAPSLRRKCQDVPLPIPDDWFFRDQFLGHLQDLRDTLAATSNGLALASNQILAEGWRVFVARPGLRVPGVRSMWNGSTDGMQGFPEIVINPRWEAHPPHEIDQRFEPGALDEHTGFVEGCLSVPELDAPVPRQYWLEMEYQDEDGRASVYVARGLGARIVQHECDHLDGRLIYDLVDPKRQVRVRMEAIRNRKRGR